MSRRPYKLRFRTDTWKKSHSFWHDDSLCRTRIENRVWASMRLFVVICCHPQVPWSKTETEPTTWLTDKRENKLARPTQKKQGVFFSVVTPFLWLDETFPFGSVTGSFIKKKKVMVTGETQCRPGDFLQRRGPHTHVSKLEREEGGKKRQENRSQFRVRFPAVICPK